jgi:hypothetical protein
VFALCFGLGLAQSPPQADPLEPRVQALEAEVAALKQDFAAQAARVAQTTGYLAAQKHRAAALLKTLDQSEQEGFTAGINYRSREVLLAGLRSWARGQGLDLTGAKQDTRR